MAYCKNFLRDGITLYIKDKHTDSDLVVRVALRTMSMGVRHVGISCELRAYAVNRWSSSGAACLLCTEHIAHVVNRWSSSDTIHRRQELPLTALGVFCSVSVFQ